MKAIKSIALLTMFTLLTASCVERSNKYITAIAERDSIALEKQTLDSNFNQTITLLNEIEAGFAVINQNEQQLQVKLKGGEGKKPDQRELIAAQMLTIKENLDKNKAKIAELRALETRKNKANGILTEENSQLSQTIKLLQSKMDEQGVQIQALQVELQQKNIVINELTSTVNEQHNELEQQREIISDQVIDKNMVWYCIASSKKLKEAKIVTGDGLFQSSKVMATAFDKKVFTQIDLRKVSMIPSNSYNVKILSAHPRSSYKLVTGSDKKITISIIDPSSFWSVSKYLVVKI